MAMGVPYSSLPVNENSELLVDFHRTFTEQQWQNEQLRKVRRDAERRAMAGDPPAPMVGYGHLQAGPMNNPDALSDLLV
jgi:hypothetical protein